MAREVTRERDKRKNKMAASVRFTTIGVRFLDNSGFDINIPASEWENVKRSKYADFFYLKCIDLCSVFVTEFGKVRCEKGTGHSFA